MVMWFGSADILNLDWIRSQTFSNDRPLGDAAKAASTKMKWNLQNLICSMTHDMAFNKQYMQM